MMKFKFMDNQTQDKKILMIFGSIIVTLLLILGGTVFIILSGDNNDGITKAVTDNSGKQILEITAKSGFNPDKAEIMADKPAVLRFTTQNTYDCTSSVYIPKLNINKTLPATGKTDIEIPPQKSGTVIDLTCSMGMYKSTIKVI